MKDQFGRKRIPTIFGIGLVALGIALTSVIVKMQTNLRSSASISQEPQNVKIANLSDNSFTITYQTDAATTGSVNYGKTKHLGNTQLENTDKEKGNLSPGNIHSINVEKLSPDTKYYLVVVSGENTFLNNGVPFEISTGPSISSPSASQTVIKGKVILPDGNAPNEALVYLSTNNSQLLSVTAAKDGEFIFSLKGLRTSDLFSYLEIKKDTVLRLSVISNSLKSTVLFSGETNSIPIITLSNNYDFTKDSAAIASKSAHPGFPSTKIKSENLKPQILTPKKEQVFSNRKPQFKGTSLPNETVEITIQSSENIQVQVTADSNGNWTYQPEVNLSEGKHTIIIKTRDSSGILTAVMQSFTVLAAETQTLTSTVLPSATPKPTASPTSAPTPTQTPTPSPSPSPTIATTESKAGLPPTGNSQIAILIGGIVATITGITLFLLTRAIL